MTTRSGWILGISTGLAHDASAALLGDGRIVMAVEEERLDRVKFGRGFPRLAIERCLKAGGITLHELDAIAFNFQPWRLFRSNVLLNLREMLHPKAVVPAAFSLLWSPQALLADLREAEKLRRATDGRLRVRFLDHHHCHAASAFYASPFDEAAILTLDNRGEEVSATASVGRGTRIERLGAVPFPHSLGLLYLSVTLHLGFQMGDEYKVMGLAAYGRPAYAELFRDLLQDDGRGGFRLNRAYFEYLGAERFFSRRFLDAAGPRRLREEPVTQRHMDLACSLQQRLEDVIVGLAEALHRRTGLRKLCLAGGVAFNSVANGALLRRAPFEEIFVQPAAGDAGTSLGAAFVVAHEHLNHPRYPAMTHASLGPGFTDAQIEEALRTCKLSAQRLDDVAAQTAELLAGGAVIGWFQGGMEWGPRALGARSILADPRRPQMKDLVNRCIKHREGFRPFAPAILAERAAEYVDSAHPSPFMLLVYPVRPEKRAEIPAVVHVDGTARLQTVRRDDHPLYYRLIEEFDRLTGVPVILNTSFNVNGEPIVCTPFDAIRCFFGSGLDYLVMGPYLIAKSGGAPMAAIPRAAEAFAR